MPHLMARYRRAERGDTTGRMVLLQALTDIAIQHPEALAPASDFLHDEQRKYWGVRDKRYQVIVEMLDDLLAFVEAA